MVLQVVRYGEFTQRASRQQQRTVEVSARRGVIYDRNGHELAMTINVDSVFAVPSEIPDQANAATLIAHVLKVEPKEVLAKIQGSRSFSWIARKLDAEDSNRIRALGLKGIYFQKESKRFYPKRDLAAQVLGYVGLDDEGLGGIERSFDEQMRGKPGKMLVSVDARQRSLGRVEKQPESGQSIVLTIDEKIQYIAERELERSMAETHAEAGTVVVQNPKTGEILALASRPTFNPNAFRTSTPQALKNRAVSDIYEPGSTFKIVTLSAALEEKLTRPDEVIDCQMGSIMVFGRKVHDHKPFGNLTVSQVLQKSSDVGAIKLGLRLGDQRMDQYIRAFGFGTQTGLELPGETRGMAKPASRWTKSSIGSIAMGQEVGVSSVQLVSMASTIANDGIYTPARIVVGSIAPRATLQTVVFKPAQQRRVVSSLTAVEMKKILEEVVLFGTGKKAILDGYTSGGKTGTAQKIDPATGRYSASKYIASFAGFAPVANPAITISVMLDSPQGGHHGGDVGAPLFGRVAQQVLAYMNVPHDTDIKNPQRLMIRASAKESDFSEGSPDRLSGDVEIADASVVPEPATAIAAKPVATKKESDRAKLIAASFTPAKQAPVATTKTEPAPAPAIPQPTPTRGTVILDAGGGPTAPSLIGKSVRAAIETAQESGVELDVVGTGVARAQAPAAGERVPPGTRVVVKFAR
ncbi:MAG: peptidoglycan synthetase FtsI [Acidobacteriaceae bacterium]|nr:peptidoglycan synthetase FtsI [Acidobacteriaceae bacterium]